MNRFPNNNIKIQSARRVELGCYDLCGGGDDTNGSGSDPCVQGGNTNDSDLLLEKAVPVASICVGRGSTGNGPCIGGGNKGSISGNNLCVGSNNY